MAGYIMTLNTQNYIAAAKDTLCNNENKRPKKSDVEKLSIELALKDVLSKGVYSTKLHFKNTNSNWSVQKLGTLGDYITMKEGDFIFFFVKRKIYGCGQLININKYDCKFKNFPNANSAVYNPEIINNVILFSPSTGCQSDYRFLCTFVPSPHFFIEGVDMDEILSFNPEAYKMLRAMWKVSFIKVDDNEAIALRNHILKNNESYLNDYTQQYPFDYSTHKSIAQKLELNFENYRLTSKDFINDNKSEMSVEVTVLEYISNNSTIFGHWDFITHQYIASPFKPVDYMDKMDLFGYRYIERFPGALSKYLVGEIKSGKITKKDIEQLMKYVDWVAHEYAFGDYDMIEAYIIGSEIDKDLKYYKNIFSRMYTKGTRPVKTQEWSDVKFINHNSLTSPLEDYKELYGITD